MAGISQGGSSATGSFKYDGKNYSLELSVLSSLFFMWAFVTNLNDILIVQLKKACDLNNMQAALVQFAFFTAYGIMSLPSGAIVKKVGYKSGILIGLAAMFAGSLVFVPAAMSREYWMFLAALFIMASGVTLLQVAANPYVAILGKPETSSARLNLTQAINSLGATLGPIVGGFLIFEAAGEALTNLDAMTLTELENWRSLKAQAVIMPYLGISALLVLIGGVIWFTPLPKIDAELEHVDSHPEVKPKNGSIFQYKHLVWGVVAIFFYVGAEVAVASWLIPFAAEPSMGSMGEHDAKFLPSTFMLLAMCGRFLGAVVLRFIRPDMVVGFFSFGAFALLMVVMNLESSAALYFAVGVGFFNSIMFPTIFTLAIKELGSYTKLGSSLLIMGIVGGAFIPVLMGFVSDQANSIQFSFIVPALCYVLIAWYGFVGSKVKVTGKEAVKA